MAKHSVLIYAEESGFYEELAGLKLKDLDIILATSDDEARAALEGVDTALVNPGLLRPLIGDAPKLTWVQTVTVGVDPLLKDGVRRDYVLTNARGILGPKLAEYTFAHILSYKKRVLEYWHLQQEKLWESKSVPSLAGETLVLLGTGSIGSHIAIVAKAFGMRTVGYRSKKEPQEHFDEIYTGNELPMALSKGDYVVSVLPATKDTNHIIRKETISHMKDGAVFMNIGRGNAVNEEDIFEAILKKKLARVILDVFAEEPLPKTSPLWSEENIIITPHMAGYADARSVVALFARNYERFSRGEELEYRVNFEKGY